MGVPEELPPNSELPDAGVEVATRPVGLGLSLVVTALLDGLGPTGDAVGRLQQVVRLFSHWAEEEVVTRLVRLALPLGMTCDSSLKKADLLQEASLPGAARMRSTGNAEITAPGRMSISWRILTTRGYGRSLGPTGGATLGYGRSLEPTGGNSD